MRALGLEACQRGNEGEEERAGIYVPISWSIFVKYLQYLSIFVKYMQ